MEVLSDEQNNDALMIGKTDKGAVAPVELHGADMLDDLAREPIVAGLASLRSQALHGSVK